MVLRLIVANVCNNDCVNCHVFKISRNHPPKPFMELADMELAVSEFLEVAKAKQATAITVAFYGGEPLLNPAIFNLIEKYDSLKSGIGIKWVLYTNGTLLNEERMVFLKAHEVEIHLSCDGQAETHNKNRKDKSGQGTFVKVENALRLIKKYKLRAQLNTFLMPENYQNAHETIDLAELYGIKKVYIDYFYSSKGFLNSDQLSGRVLKLTKYGQSKKIKVLSLALITAQKARDNSFIPCSMYSSDYVQVETDGSFYFSSYPLSKAKRLPLSQMSAFFLSARSQVFNLSVSKYYKKNCSACVLKNYCFGLMISTYQYHTGQEAGYEPFCEYLRQDVKTFLESGDDDVFEKDKRFSLVHLAVTYSCNRSCPYCYAKGMEQEYIAPIKMEDYLRFLDWLEINGEKRFNFIGGEPTRHPRIKEMAKIAKARGFEVIMFTNCLFPEQYADFIKDLHHLTVNFGPPHEYHPNEYETVKNNLRRLSAQGAGIAIACNISPGLKDIDHILELSREVKIDEVHINMVGPNAFKANEFVGLAQMRELKKKVLGFIGQLADNNINYAFGRPLPRCIFTEKELLKLKGKIYFKCGSGKNIVLVNPDLTVFPCGSLFFKGPEITEFKDISDYQDFYEHAIAVYQKKKTLFPHCPDCEYFGEECVGGCINDRLKPFSIRMGEGYIINSQLPIGDFEARLQEAIGRLENIFGKLSRKIAVYLLESRQEMDFFSGIYYWPEWVKGFALTSKSGRLNYYQVGLENEMLLHEICHLFIVQYRLVRLPSWLTEGVCEYVSLKDNTPLLRAMLKKHEPISFGQMSELGDKGLLEIDTQPVKENICYQQAHNFVRFLADKKDLKHLLRLIKIEPDDDFGSHFKRIYGRSLEAMEKIWLDTLR